MRAAADDHATGHATGSSRAPFRSILIVRTRRTRALPLIMPTNVPPPSPNRGAPSFDDVPARRSWVNVARWKRWLVYWVALCIALGGVGAAIAEPNSSETAEPSATTTSPELIVGAPATTSEPTPATSAPVPTTTEPVTVPVVEPPATQPQTTEPPTTTSRSPPSRPLPRRPNHRPLPRRRCRGRRSPSTCWR